jgi:hypothetical protein
VTHTRKEIGEEAFLVLSSASLTVHNFDPIIVVVVDAGRIKARRHDANKVTAEQLVDWIG